MNWKIYKHTCSSFSRFPVLSGFSNQCACSVKFLIRGKKNPLDESQPPVFDGNVPSISEDELPSLSADGGRPPISDGGRPPIFDGSRPSISSDPDLSTEFEALVNHINKETF